ncbi:MAG: nitronate monooxygenase [Steroidobacter sp.]
MRKPTARYTTLTRAFSGRHARGIKNRVMRELKPHESTAAPFPMHSVFTRPIWQAAIRANDPDTLALWAGQSAGLIRHTRAAELVQFLLEDGERVLQRLRGISRVGLESDK